MAVSGSKAPVAVEQARSGSHDNVVSRGMVTSGSMLAATHRAGSAVRQWAGHAVYQHPRLYQATLRARNALR